MDNHSFKQSINPPHEQTSSLPCNGPYYVDLDLKTYTRVHAVVDKTEQEKQYIC